MTHSTAKAIAFASTKDWNIGGKFTAKATDSTTMEISGGYSSSSSETITRTDSFEDSVTCPAFTECRFETRSFLVEITGICRNLPVVDCSYGNTVMCDDRSRWANSCDLYKKHSDKCDTEPDSDCTVSFPVLESDGQLMKQIALVTSNLKKTMKQRIWGIT
ncbi:hypothetical protein LOZ36_002720 [Ophidiomyces ophidiicola]|nr:hypothetical protein LOZ36_002720 [Ophidiomyces ophidiicola]